SPEHFLAAVSDFADELLNPANEQAQSRRFDSVPAFAESMQSERFRRVIGWSLLDSNRITPVPPDHWLLIEDTAPFRASLKFEGSTRAENIQSVPAAHKHIACFAPRESA